MSSHLKKTRALVVEPYPLFRLGLCHWINREKNLIVCAEAENIRQVLEAIENLQPDLVISEISLNGMNSFDWIRRITSDNSNLPILLFTKYDETIYAERALRAGVLPNLVQHAIWVRRVVDHTERVHEVVWLNWYRRGQVLGIRLTESDPIREAKNFRSLSGHLE